MTGAGPAETRVPDPDVLAVDRLVGSWRIGGDATGHVMYRWLPGRFFLVQEGDLELFGHRNRFTEVIGHHRPFGEDPIVDIASRVYTAEGDTLDCVYELAGDTLTIWGGHRDSDSSYVGTFSADGDVLDGAWSWPGGGYRTTTIRESADPGQAATQPDARPS